VIGACPPWTAVSATLETVLRRSRDGFVEAVLKTALDSTLENGLETGLKTGSGRPSLESSRRRLDGLGPEAVLETALKRPSRRPSRWF